MANRWENVWTVADFTFLGSKITVDGNSSHEIKRRLFLGRKAMTNLDSILKSRKITLLTKGHIIKAMVFPVVIHRCESWTLKKAEGQRTDVFKLWCWRRRASPLDSKDIKPVNSKGNHTWIFIGRTDAEAEAPTLWPPDAKSWIIGKGPTLGKIEGKRRRGWQRMRWLDGITDAMDIHLIQLCEIVKNKEAWVAAVHRVTKSWTWLSDYTTTGHNQLTFLWIGIICITACFLQLMKL